MAWCPKCDNFMLFPNSHRCPPEFVCEPADTKGYGEGYEQTICASDAEAAAEKFCEQWDAGGDYDIIRGGEFEVKVTDRGGDVTYWHIVAESVPSYSAYASKTYPLASVDERSQSQDPEEGLGPKAASAVPAQQGDAQTLSGQPS